MAACPISRQAKQTVFFDFEEILGIDFASFAAFAFASFDLRTIWNQVNECIPQVKKQNGELLAFLSFSRLFFFALLLKAS